MIYPIIAANLKNYIDLSGKAEELTPEKSVFQLSIGGKKEKTGWHYIVQDGSCQFKRGLYTGEIFIDWNDEFKYKEKSKKQIKQETTPDYEVTFKSGDEFESFAASAAAFVCGKSSKKPKVHGTKLSGTRCVPSVFDQLLIECVGLQSAEAIDAGDDELIGFAVRMALYALAEEFNLLLKDGDETLKAFAAGSRRSYFFDTAEGNKGTWLTVQSGVCKVTANQGSRLPALCGLSFADNASALRFVYGSSGPVSSVNDSLSRDDLFDLAYSFRGASTYGSDVDQASVRATFRECCLKAAGKMANGK